MDLRWWCALIILLALPPGCGKAPRDDGGRLVQVSPAMPLSAANFSVVIPDVALRGAAPRFTRTELNNGQVRIDSMIVPGQGSLRVQYAPDGFFGLQTEHMIRDRTAFVAWMTRLLPNVGGARPPADAPIAPVVHPHYRTVGYTYFGPPGADGRRCFAGRAGYRVKGRTIYDNDVGESDMEMEAIFCGSVSDTEEFARLFSQVSPRI